MWTIIAVPNLLALDIGEKRIGVAIADMEVPFPAPLVTLEASEHLATEFKALLRKNQVKAVVIGLPRNQKGERTAQTDRVEHIAKLLKVPDEVPTYWQDESLTSVKAEEELNKRKKPFAKAAVDSLAATYILEDFIRTQASGQLPLQSSDVHATKLKKTHFNKRKWFLRVVLLLLATVLLIVSSAAAWYIKAISPRTKDDIYSVISVKSGSGTRAIASELQQKKVIRSADAFALYAKLSGTNNLQVGEYRLSSKQSVKSIVETIAGGKVTNVNVLISPGLRLDQIVDALIKDGFTEADVNVALVSVRDHSLLKNLPATIRLEGYLFPDTYKIGPSTTAEELIRLMLNNFQEKITPETLAKLSAQDLTLEQAIILASIVQKEVRDVHVQPTVAQVFIKRYQQGTMLGSDVTYMYIGGLTGKTVDPGLNSPYNTRRFAGLPPTPISNFNISALNAVANPSKTDYLFFVAGDDGQTYFSKTVEEHEALVKKYCTKLCH